MSKNWLPFLVVALAFLVRVWALELKPPHFDEGVNGAFVDNLRRVPSYEYRPDNFHGPLHFYAMFTSTQFFGRGVWALRFPTVVIGAATVALVFAFRRFFSVRTVFVAAVAMAISPGMIFYSRYAIHETWLPFFTLLAMYGAFGIAGGERRLRDLWCVGVGISGMVLTKETYVLHFAAAFLAWRACRSMFSSSPREVRTRPSVVFGVEESAPEEVQPAFARADIQLVVGVCIAVVVTLYSGLFGYWRGVGGIFETFIHMARKGWTVSEEGHHKELLYYVKLFGIYEWPAFAGLMMAPVFALRRSGWAGGIALVCGVALFAASWLWTAGQPVSSHAFQSIEPFLETRGIRWDTPMSLGFCLAAVGACLLVAIPLKCPRLRFLALYGLASVAAYSFVSYKTPWCVINLIWPFWFLLGHLFDRMTQHSDGRLVVALGCILAMIPLLDAHRINIEDPAANREPYIYVQQTRDLELLTKPVEKLIERDPQRRNSMTGYIIYDSPQPLPWALPELKNVVLLSHVGPISFGDADFLLVHESRVEEVESQLLDIYFRSRFRFFGEDENHRLYLRATTFHDLVEPGRVAEFHRRIPLEPEGER